MKYLVLFILTVSIGFSQTISVKYIEQKILDREKIEQIPEFAREEALKMNLYKLIYSDGNSIYKNDELNLNSDKSTSIENEALYEDSKTITTTIYRVTSNNNEKWYYKEYINNLMYFNLNNANKNWDGKDSLHDWSWQLTNETKNISGYVCKKAISNQNGMILTAWYSEEIPVNAGPEKFDGLPGLIFYVGTQFFKWEATDIKIETRISKIEKPIMPEKTYTLNEVFSYVGNEVSKLRSGTTTKTEGNSTSTTTTTIIRN